MGADEVRKEMLQASDRVDGIISRRIDALVPEMAVISRAGRTDVETDGRRRNQFDRLVFGEHWGSQARLASRSVGSNEAANPDAGCEARPS
jgi:hypothetical protein